jgi:xylulose-5-phosphate/fructose-6-phosphate phosphoketolase
MTLTTFPTDVLSSKELHGIHGYWRACNYLAVGMIYLRANPLLREPLQEIHIKRRLLGHWGASPALSFSYVHLNRLINKYDLNAIFMAGPGHGAPGVIGPVYLEGTYSEVYPDKSEDMEGMEKLFRWFSFPGVLVVIALLNYLVRSTRGRIGLQPCPCLWGCL